MPSLTCAIKAMSSPTPSVENSRKWVPAPNPCDDAGAAAVALSEHLFSRDSLTESDSDCAFQAGDGSDTVFRLHCLVVTQSPMLRGMLCGGFKEAAQTKPIVLQDCMCATLENAFGFIWAGFGKSAL